MSDPSPVQPIQPDPVSGAAPRPSREENPAGPSFAELLKNSIAEVDQLQKQADVAIERLATGKSESLTEVLTAVEKADLAFRTLMQIRTKLLDAYQEISRMRI